MTALCHCVVVAHPAGSVWIAQAVDKSCPEHAWAEPYREAS